MFGRLSTSLSLLRLYGLFHRSLLQCCTHVPTYISTRYIHRQIHSLLARASELGFTFGSRIYTRVTGLLTVNWRNAFLFSIGLGPGTSRAGGVWVGRMGTFERVQMIACSYGMF